MSSSKQTAFAITDIGMKRKNNQDAYLKDDSLGLYVVADGMGGHKGGEVASRLCVEVIQKHCAENPVGNGRDLLDQGINRSCHEIYDAALKNQELSGMGTTVAALLVQEEEVFIGQVGDSRAYLVVDDSLWQVTEDHSLLNEEIRSGRILEDQVANYQFKNVITRSVGYESKVVVDVYRRRRQPGDIYFLCTDGLSGTVNGEEIARELARCGLEIGLRNLVALANARGGDDNITALVCRID